MSINGVNSNVDIQKLLKTMKNGQAQKGGLSSKVPAHMTMNGSIFSANAKTISSASPSNPTQRSNGTQRTNNGTPLSRTTTTDNVVQTNTEKSVSKASEINSSSSLQMIIPRARLRDKSFPAI